MAPDKWKHFYVGALLGLVFQGAAMLVFPHRWTLSFLTTFGVVIAISYGFELFSLISGLGHYELMDAVAAVAGGLLGQGLIFMLWGIF